MAVQEKLPMQGTLLSIFGSLLYCGLTRQIISFTKIRLIRCFYYDVTPNASAQYGDSAWVWTDFYLDFVGFILDFTNLTYVRSELETLLRIFHLVPSTCGLVLPNKQPFEATSEIF